MKVSVFHAILNHQNNLLNPTLLGLGWEVLLTLDIYQEPAQYIAAGEEDDTQPARPYQLIEYGDVDYTQSDGYKDGETTIAIHTIIDSTYMPRTNSGTEDQALGQLSSEEILTEGFDGLEIPESSSVANPKPIIGKLIHTRDRTTQHLGNLIVFIKEYQLHFSEKRR